MATFQSHARNARSSRIEPALLESRQERLDDDVLGRCPVAKDQVGNGLDLPAIGREQVRQRLGSAPAERRHGHVFFTGVISSDPAPLGDAV